MLACLALILVGGIGPFADQRAGAVDSPAASPVQGRTHLTGPLQPSPEFQGADVSIDLVALTPSALTPGQTLKAEVEVTNAGTDVLENAILDFSMNRTRVTDRDALTEWAARSGEDDLVGLGLSRAASAPATIAPGQRVRMSVELPVDALGLELDTTLWGPRRVALTVRTGAETQDRDGIQRVSAPGTARSTLRTFVVWQPSQETPTIDLAYLTPIHAEDPAELAIDPEGFVKDATTGELADRLEISQRADVDWWLDPSLLAEVALPEAGSVLSTVRTPAADGTSPTTPANAPSDAGGASEDDAAPSAGEPSTTTAPEDDSSPTDEPEARWEPNPTATEVRSDLLAAREDRGVVAAPYALADLPTLGGNYPEVTTLLGKESEGLLDAPTLARISGSEASAERVQSAVDAGATAVLVPAESLYVPLSPAVTPSGYGQVNGTPALGYDARLTHLAESTAMGTDPELDVQRALADTALIAGQDTDAARSILVAPDPTATLDPDATALMLDALHDSAWVERGSVRTMLTNAADGRGTTELRRSDTSDQEPAPLWAGTLGQIQSVQVEADGTPRALDASTTGEATSPAPATDEHVRTVSAELLEITAVRSVLEDQRYANAAWLLAASGVSEPVLRAPEDSESRLADLTMVVVEQSSRIELTTSESYNLVSAGSGVPISIRNDFDTRITVHPKATMSERIVRVSDSLEPISVPAHSSTDATIPIEAITSGSLELTVSLDSESGHAIHTSTAALSVNPEWENWTTLILVIAMALLVVVGVVRAGRKKSDARAPAERGPEDLSTLDDPSAPATKEP